MTAELFIHGPRHAYYGPQSEAAYSQLFDNSQIKDDVRFVVEIRRGADGKNYAYYNYCRYNNMQDIDGRSGAYIGISIRLDAYYTNLKAMFVVLESAFNRGSIGLLVDKVPDGYRYCVASFDQVKQQILEKIEKPLGVLLSNLYNPSEFLSIDSSFNTGREILKAIDDTGAVNARLKDIRSFGKIIFASAVPTEAMKEADLIYGHRINELNRQHEQNTAEIKTALENYASKNTELNSALSQKIAEIDVLETRVKSLNGRIEELRTMENQFKGLEHQNTTLKVALKKETQRSFDQKRIIGRLNSELENCRREISELKDKYQNSDERSYSHHNKSHQPDENDNYRNNQKKGFGKIHELWEGFKKYIVPFFFFIGLAIFICVSIVLYRNFFNH